MPGYACTRFSEFDRPAGKIGAEQDRVESGRKGRIIVLSERKKQAVNNADMKSAMCSKHYGNALLCITAKQQYVMC
jgi:hypothetical protein